MRNVKHYDTPLEVAVRSALHRKGYRFRKHVKNLPGKPDVVFPSRKVVVFVDGDFWHGYNYEGIKEGLKPFWRAKIEGNMVRDEKNFALLHESGWTVLRFWGHEVQKDLDGCVKRIEDALNPNDAPT